MRNEEVLKRIGITKKLLITIRKRLEILETMRKESLEDLTLIGCIKGKRGLCKWIEKQVL